MGDALQNALSPFERLAILRDEIEQRNKELNALERSISTVRDAMNRRKYLWTLCPEFYKDMPPPEGARELPGLLEKKRLVETLAGKLNDEKNNVEASLKNASLEQHPQSGSRPAPPGAAPARKARFASFDQFSPPQRPQS